MSDITIKDGEWHGTGQPLERGAIRKRISKVLEQGVELMKVREALMRYTGEGSPAYKDCMEAAYRLQQLNMPTNEIIEMLTGLFEVAKED